MSKYHRIQEINTDTGEVVGNTLLKIGSSEEVILKTANPKQEEAIKKKNKDVSEITQYIQDNEGRFFHLIYKYSFPLMVELQSKCKRTNANTHIMRFMILGTYMTFGGKLFDENGNEIKKSNLGKIWKVENDRKSTNETYELLKDCNYIYESEEGYIMINQDLIVKGVVEDFKELKKHDKDLTYTRVFSDNIQAMYEGTEARQRKQLANLFKILPFINFKYNVFCTNPTETDEAKVNLMSWKELAELCGYNSNQSSRFRNDMFNLSIFDYDVIGEFRTKSGLGIVVNPKIYYGGHNVEDVKHLYAMFQMCSK